MRLYKELFFSEIILEIEDYGYLCSRSAKEAQVLRQFAATNSSTGGMAERLNALVLKTSVPRGTGGSNPSSSAFARRSSD